MTSYEAAGLGFPPRPQSQRNGALLGPHAMPPYALHHQFECFGHASSVPSSKLLPTTPNQHGFFQLDACGLSRVQGFGQPGLVRAEAQAHVGGRALQLLLIEGKQLARLRGQVRRSALGCRVREGS